MDVSQKIKELDLPDGIIKFSYNMFEENLNDLYYPDLYVLPLTQEGEIIREYLYNDELIGRYGAYEHTIEFENELYNVILVNND